MVPTSMTLNDLERRSLIALILRLSPNSIALQTDYVTVVEDVRKILSPSSSLPLSAKTTHPEARSLCDS